MDAPFRSPSDADRGLFEHARGALDNAYVPYSHFRVGAAVQLDDGTVVTGCNVENAAYSMTICAERTALVRLVAEGHDPATIRRISVAVDGRDGQPCGACRQVIVELAPTAHVSFLSDGSLVCLTGTELLPGAFVPAALDA